MGFSYLNSYRWFVEAKHSLFSLKGQPVDPRLIALQENNFTSFLYFSAGRRFKSRYFKAGLAAVKAEMFSKRKIQRKGVSEATSFCVPDYSLHSDTGTGQTDI
jgi:hypothetical protein